MITCDVAVLGAGSWGTALAVHLARTGHPTVLWGRDAAQMAALATARCNTRYLPMAPFPESLRVESDLARAVGSAQELLMQRLHPRLFSQYQLLPQTPARPRRVAQLRKMRRSGHK